jgi:hypothetical protein
MDVSAMNTIANVVEGTSSHLVHLQCTVDNEVTDITLTANTVLKLRNLIIGLRNEEQSSVQRNNYRTNNRMLPSHSSNRMTGLVDTPCPPAPPLPPLASHSSDLDPEIVKLINDQFEEIKPRMTSLLVNKFKEKIQRASAHPPPDADPVTSSRDIVSGLVDSVLQQPPTVEEQKEIITIEVTPVTPMDDSSAPTTPRLRPFEC